MKILFWLALVLIIYTYLAYPVILYILSRAKQQRFYSSEEELPKVSIIVSAYNEEDVIEAKINNLLSIDYPKNLLEIIIASDGSDDRTNEIVKKYTDRGVILIDYETRRGKVQVLNNSIPQAKNNIIVLTDANTFFKGDAVKKLIRNFENENIGAVCGEIRFKSNKKNKLGELEGFYWRYEVFLKKIEGTFGSLLGANGGIYAIRKDLFETLPGNTIIDDFVIPMKILEKGYKVVYEPEAVAYEETAKSIIKEMARRVRIGAGDFQSLVLTRRLLNPLRGFCAFAFWSHKVIRWFVPFFLTVILFFNAFLVGEKIYLWLFLAQISFYALALLGRILSAVQVNVKALGFPYYFVSMNIALFLGFFKFLTGTQKVTWEKTRGETV